MHTCTIYDSIQDVPAKVPMYRYVKARNPIMRALLKRLARQLFPEQHMQRQNVFKEMKLATVPSSPKVL